MLLDDKVERKNLIGGQRFQYVKQIIEDVTCKNYSEMKKTCFKQGGVEICIKLILKLINSIKTEQF